LADVDVSNAASCVLVRYNPEIRSETPLDEAFSALRARQPVERFERRPRQGMAVGLIRPSTFCASCRPSAEPGSTLVANEPISDETARAAARQGRRRGTPTYAESPVSTLPESPRSIRSAGCGLATCDGIHCG
jgi:hypothetical protein